MGFSMCCEDDLLKEFIKFKHGKVIDNDMMERFLHYYKPIILPTKEQFEFLDNDLRSRLVRSGYAYDLKTALLKTTYKIVLSNTRNDFPYVNINSDEIENNFTGTFCKNQSRDKAIEHIKALLNECQKSLLIQDNFLLTQNVYNKFFSDFIKLMPQKPIDIFYDFDDRNSNNIITEQEFCTELKRIYNYPNIKRNMLPKYKNIHDRYILVDQKIEIVLSSGIDNLFDISKDFTYIVRII